MVRGIISLKHFFTVDFYTFHRRLKRHLLGRAVTDKLYDAAGNLFLLYKAHCVAWLAQRLGLGLAICRSRVQFPAGGFHVT